MHGPSWFWSGGSLRAPRSVVSSHASQTQCLTEKHALAATSRGLEASGCWWVSHMQEGDNILCPLHLNPLGHILSFLMGFHPLHECNRCNWPARPKADATPQTWEVREKAPKYTQMMATERKYKTEWERDTSMEISRHDYSNTVIKEEMYFRLSGWLMRDSKSTQMLLFSLPSRSLPFTHRICMYVCAHIFVTYWGLFLWLMPTLSGPVVLMANKGRF